MVVLGGGPGGGGGGGCGGGSGGGEEGLQAGCGRRVLVGWSCRCGVVVDVSLGAKVTCTFATNPLLLLR